MSQDRESWQKHPDLYISDGTIVLLAGSTLFRVYAKLLAMHSKVFRKIIDASPENADIYNNYPLIKLDDRPEDVAYFLKVIMGLWDPPMSYSMASSILRFSSKYMAHSIKKQVTEQFKHVIPQSFDEVGHTKSYAQVFGSDELQPHPFQLLSLFRECKLMSFLPWTYYTICSLGFEKICQGGTMHDGKETHLNPDDIRIALLGWKALCRMTCDIRVAMIGPPTPCCFSNTSTNTKHFAWMKKVTSTFQSEAMGEWEMFKVLAYSYIPTGMNDDLYGEYDFTQIHGRPCGSCIVKWREAEKKGRAAVWPRLPGIFELPDWDIEMGGRTVTAIKPPNNVRIRTIRVVSTLRTETT